MVRSRPSAISRFVILLFVIWSFGAGAATPASAQTSAPPVRGSVVDPQNRPVARATIIVVRGNDVVATATSDLSGRFGPILLPAGEYEVLGSARGLNAPAVKVTIPASGAAVAVSLKLALAARSESVVVSGSQVGHTLSRATDAVTVFDRDEIDRRQVETATDVIRTVPGFGVIANGGRGAVTSLFPRGGESDYTLVMMNGLPLNAFGGGFDAAHLATAGVERIEVVRGPQSAIFGSGAVGGVVNVITNTGGPPRLGGIFEAAGQGTSRAQIFASGSWGDWFMGGSFEGLTSDGDSRTFASTGGAVPNDDYERLAGTLSGGWSDSATRRVRVDAHFDRTDRGNPGPYGSDPFGLYFPDTISRSTTRPRGVTASAVFGEPGTIRQGAVVSWYDLPSFFTSPFGDSEDRVRRVAARYQADFDLGPISYSAGGEFTSERADNTFVTGEAFSPVPVRRTMGGLFAEARLDLGTRAAITAGVRADRIERQALEENGFGRPPFEDDVVWSTNPKIAGVFFLRGNLASDGSTGWTKIRGGAGTGIKPPTVFDIAFTDNPSLRPERSRSFDVGVEHAFAGALLIADATFFANRYDDLIVAVGQIATPVSPFQTDNIANASAKGVEIGARWTSTFGISVRGAYTYLDTEVLAIDNIPGQAPAPFDVGDPLIRRPRHQGSLEVSYARGRLSLFLLINGRGETSDFEPNFAAAVLTAPGYSVVSIGGNFRINNWLDAYARVTNLGDALYEEALGYPALGRSAAAGIRVGIGR